MATLQLFTLTPTHGALGPRVCVKPVCAMPDVGMSRCIFQGAVVVDLSARMDVCLFMLVCPISTVGIMFAVVLSRTQ